ncbi:hypothetical protein NP233_g4673 [Leucocoprinus birnbaumii]|uniref:Integrase catalytic domain-containing protein n=1 Tax=Leucocoprinus birnbaumii TaxID=56174 RepID=A0AAD5YX25_9AGAR|nr:hypothetical protein NP233_g4673 [Leucocoprinus birnbaumii]
MSQEPEGKVDTNEELEKFFIDAASTPPVSPKHSGSVNLNLNTPRNTKMTVPGSSSQLPPAPTNQLPTGGTVDITTLLAALQTLTASQMQTSVPANNTATSTTPPSYSTLTPIPRTAWKDCPILERSQQNWKAWSSNMLNTLESYSAFDYVFNDDFQIAPTDDVGLRNWKNNHRAICGFIRNTIESKEVEDFRKIANAKTLWDELKRVYNCANIVNRCDLNARIWNSPFSWSSPVSTQYWDICNAVDALLEHGVPTRDDLVLLALTVETSDTPDSKAVLSQAQAVLNSNAKSTHVNVYNLLLQAEASRKCDIARGDHAMVVTTPKAAKGGNQKGKGKSKERKPKETCSNCEGNHNAKYCVKQGGGMVGKTISESILAQKLDSSEKSKNGVKFSFNNKTYTVQEETAAAVVEVPEPDSASFLAESMCEADIIELANSTVETACNLNIIDDIAAITSRSSTKDFLLDSACTVHVSPDKTDFISLHPVNDRRVKGVNGSMVEAQGVGDILLKAVDGTCIMLKDALYVPKATVKLVSIARLIDQLSGSIRFTNEEAFIYDKHSTCISTGTRIPGYNLWRLNNFTPSIDFAHVALPTPTLETWHCRLGHTNVQAIHDMTKKGLATGMKIDLSLAPPKCDSCILGKQVRSPVPKEWEEERSTRRLGLVYVDLTGPQEVLSASGNSYIMNIVDDFTGFPWTFVIPHKSDAFTPFKKWALRVEQECGRPINIVQIDNGELKSREMTEFCQSKGTLIRYTAPNTSAHNGRVERMHLTIMNKARAMQVDTGLPDNCWDELVRTASYLTARTYTCSTGKTPYELWHGRKPDLSHLREIGARAFTLVLNKNNPKIQPRSIECMLIGYSDDSKAYRLYHRQTHKSGKIFNIPSPPSSNTEPISEPVVEPEQPRPQPRRSARLAGNPPPNPSLFTDDEFITEAILTAEDVPPPPSSKSPKAERKKRARERRKMRLAIRNAMNTMPQDVAEAFYEIALSVAIEEADNPNINIMYPDDLKTLEEALKRTDGDLWRASIQEELDSLKDRGVYILVPRSLVPNGRKVMTGKWVLVSKRDEKGEIAHYKARLVARGFQQIFGLDFTDTTSPTTRLESLRVLLHLAAVNDLDIRQLDIKTAYLYGVLPEEEIQYMEQPAGFEVPGKEDWVWELHKGLYGMKQSGRVWNKTLNEALNGWDFQRLQSEPCGFRRVSPEGVVDACVHVDDFLYSPSNDEASNNFLEHPVHPTYSPMDPSLKLQRPSTTEKLSSADIKHLKSLPYRSLVSSMMYVATGTRPDICYAVSKLAQYLDCYRDAHWDAALRVARYLYTTRDMKLWLGGKNPTRLLGFSDSSYADCPDTRRSSMGYCFSLGSGVVSWSSKKQKTVSCSTTEAEYIAVGEATRESIWLRTHLAERNNECKGATIIFCDNNGAITLSKDPIHHTRNKHIDVRHHFIREKVEDQQIDVWRVSTEDNVADVLTKALAGAAFERFRDALGDGENPRRIQALIHTSARHRRAYNHFMSQEPEGKVDTNEELEKFFIDAASTPPVSPKHSAWKDCPILERSQQNWKAWSSNMLNTLESYSAFDYVFNDDFQIAPTDDVGLRNWKNNHRAICGFIRNTIESKEVEDFRKIANAKTLWDELKRVYNCANIVNRCDLNARIWNSPFSWSSPVSTQYRDICNAVDALLEHGVPTRDDLVLLALMWNLDTPDSKAVLSQAQAVLNSNAKSTHINVYNLLLQVEASRKRDIARGDHAMVVTTPKAAKGGNQKGKGKSKERKPKETCSNCEGNHNAKYCVKQGGGMAGKTISESILAQKLDSSEKSKNGVKFSFNNKTYTVQEETAAAVVEVPEPDSASFLAESMCEADIIELANSTVETACNLNIIDDIAAITSRSSTKDFLLDSACTVHVSPDKTDFISLHPVNDRRVKGVNGSMVEAQGVGDILLKAVDGTCITLKDALYVPKATVKLVSIARLIDQLSGSIRFTNEEAFIYDKHSTCISTGTRIPGYNLWRLNNFTPSIDFAHVALPTPTLETWHRRLGHANVQAIHDMAKKGLATGMKIDLSLAPPKCDSCILGKQVRSPVPKEREEERSMRRLGLVYVDLTGPQEVLSASGNSYVMNIVDDFTGFPWTFVIPHKSDAFTHFKKWALRVEQECGRPINIVQIDNGELKSREMTEFCQSKGTLIRYTAPNTSAHNSRVERMHLTIMNKARAMRVDTGLPDNRWDELVRTASYLTARTYTRSTGKTPYELWHGRKPDLSHLREIGARAFTLVLNKNNPKIQPRSIECVLIGYSDDSKAYRLYHRQTHKVITSFHVQFIEALESRPQPVKSGKIINIPSPPSSNTEPISEPVVEPEQSCPQPRRSARLAGNPPPNPSLFTDDEFITEAILTAEDVPPPPSSKSPKAERKKRARECRKMRLAIRNAMNTMPQDVAEAFYEIALSVAIEEADNPNINIMYPDDPKTLEEALKRTDGDLWRASIQEELDSLKDRGVYILVPRSSVPNGRKVMTGKWVLVSKRDEKGEIARYKARLVARGFQQIFGLDFTDTTSPTTRLESLRVLLHLAAVNDLDIRQLDIKTAYLYGVLPEEEIQYMEQPVGFEVPGKEDWVWELHKGLYGMKQSGHVWNKTLNEALNGWDFQRLQSEPCGFRCVSPEGVVDACVHVDDFLYSPSNDEACKCFLTDIGSTWEYKDLGEAKFCVGIAFTWDRASRTIGLSQTALIEKIANNFLEHPVHPTYSPMDPSLKLQHPSTTEKLSSTDIKHLKSLPYRSLVGSMMYVATGTRPDICYAVSKLAQYLDCYRDAHWDAALRVARYLYTTRDMKLWLGGKNPTRLLGFSDSSYVDCPDTRISSMGYCFSLGSGVVSWSSKKQKTVSCSTTEAEYIAVGEATRESIWLRTHLAERNNECKGATIIFCDNNGAITLSKGPIHHARNKHIDVRHHFIREKVEDQQIDVWRVSTEDNVADVLTKALAGAAFERFRDALGVR